MKKNLFLLLTIITLFLLINNSFFEILKNDAIKGNNILDYTYIFDLNPKHYNFKGFYLDKDNIYYLLENNNTYKVYKRNIYNNKNYILTTFNNDQACNLVNNYIECKNEETINIYTYNYEIIYTSSITKNNVVIPFKDTFLKYDNNKIYNNEELDLIDYYYDLDNTYLLFLSTSNNYYVYNINEDKYEEIKDLYLGKYEFGFYFLNSYNYKIYNLKNNKNIEYENYLELEINSPTYFIKDTLYYIENTELNILDLKNNILKTTTFPLKDKVNFIIVYDYNLYFKLEDYPDKIFILNLEYLNYKIRDINEEILLLEENINTTKDNIKTDYDINIYTNDEVNIKFPDFTADIENNNKIIIDALNRITTILKKFDNSFFKQFSENNYKGLHLYLTSKLTPSNLETQIANPAAYSLINNKKYMMVIDINEPNIESLMCHELFHNIEFVLKNNNINPFLAWNSYNPNNFSYNNSYTKPYLYNYTFTEEDNNNVYFFDKYSHTYSEEDRARVFENICAYSENNIFNDYPQLYNKAIYLEEELSKYYPNLKDTTLFNTLKDE